MNAAVVEELIKVVEELPDDRVQQVLDFARFLRWQAQTPANSNKAEDFYEWVRQLAREGGFDYLTEEDVATIVHQFRARR